VTVPAQGTTRVRFQDVKPYDAPASLDDLRGPRDGELVLPHHVHWGPRRDVNLGRKGDVLTAYQATISEGMVADQVAILNRSLLLELWPELILSTRVRSLWESRFPELAATA
jgi:hypothetical protein